MTKQHCNQQHIKIRKILCNCLKMSTAVVDCEISTIFTGDHGCTQWSMSFTPAPNATTKCTKRTKQMARKRRLDGTQFTNAGKDDGNCWLAAGSYQQMWSTLRKYPVTHYVGETGFSWQSEALLVYPTLAEYFIVTEIKHTLTRLYSNFWAPKERENFSRPEKCPFLVNCCINLQCSTLKDVLSDHKKTPGHQENRGP